jgi:hypothetical protein
MCSLKRIEAGAPLLDRLSHDVHFVSGLMAHRVPFIVADLARMRTHSSFTYSPRSPRKSAPNLAAHESRSSRCEARGQILGTLAWLRHAPSPTPATRPAGYVRRCRRARHYRS